MLSKPIAIVGDVMIDVFGVIKGRGRSRDFRFSNEGEACREWRVKKTIMLPGGVGTPARVVSSLGGRATVYTVVGVNQDRSREWWWAHQLSKDGITVKTVRDQRIVNAKRRYVMDDGAPVVAFREGSVRPISAKIEDALFYKVANDESGVILISDFNRGVVTPSLLQRICQHAGSVGTRVVLDCRPRPISWYEQAVDTMSDEPSGLYLLKPNRKELGGMYGVGLREMNMAKVDELARETVRRLRANVLVTLSELGAKLYELDGQVHYWPTRATHPVSVVGAGDTCAAVTSLGLAAGLPLPTACELGLTAAAATVQKPGTQVVTFDDLRGELRKLQRACHQMAAHY